MNNNFTVRDATPADVDALVTFNCNIARETENMELAPATVTRGVRAVFENPARAFYVVAEADDGNDSHRHLIGALMVTTEWSDWRDGELWWIQSVYVVREWRRRGLYRRLYAYVKQRAAHEKNVRGFRLYVAHDNDIAQQTYAALGMEATGYHVLEELVD